MCNLVVTYALLIEQLHHIKAYGGNVVKLHIWTFTPWCYAITITLLSTAGYLSGNAPAAFKSQPKYRLLRGFLWIVLILPVESQGVFLNTLRTLRLQLTVHKSPILLFHLTLLKNSSVYTPSLNNFDQFPVGPHLVLLGQSHRSRYSHSSCNSNGDDKKRRGPTESLFATKE
jgi:hypothetical protein